jgi:hypothetical protein
MSDDERAALEYRGQTDWVRGQRQLLDIYDIRRPARDALTWLGARQHDILVLTFPTMTESFFLSSSRLASAGYGDTPYAENTLLPFHLQQLDPTGRPRSLQSVHHRRISSVLDLPHTAYKAFKMKYVLVSGGNISGIGKGSLCKRRPGLSVLGRELTNLKASSTGLLLKTIGLKICSLRIDQSQSMLTAQARLLNQDRSVHECRCGHDGTD